MARNLRYKEPTNLVMSGDGVVTIAWMVAGKRSFHQTICSSKIHGARVEYVVLLRLCPEVGYVLDVGFGEGRRFKCKHVR